MVIWLHGLGDTADGWASFMPSIGLEDTKFILPTAPTRPITLNMGMQMTGWADITGLSIDSKEDKRGMDESSARVKRIIMNEVASGLVSPSKIIVGGFSQGAALSLHTALRLDLGGQAVGGCVALSTWLPMRQEYPAALSQFAKSSMPILQIHGDADQVVPFAFGKMSNDLLASMVDVKPKFVSIRGMGHSSDEETIGHVAAFMKRILA